MRVVVAFGSNLGDRKGYIESAINELKASISVSEISSLIETDPVGGPEQGKFLNGVLIGETELSAEDLMKILLEIEVSLGRIRTVPNGPRTIDLDLIDYQGMTYSSPSLTLPHPRAYLRPFVILPWLEIEPDASLTGYGSLRELAVSNAWL